MNEDDYAVVVGITKYPEFGNLDGPENDACAFRDWLIKPVEAGGGGVAPNHIALILSRDYFKAEDEPLAAKPALYQIELEFDRLIELSSRQGGMLGRRLYVYLAGHGFGPDVEEAALLMANASRRRMYHIPGRTLARWFRTAAMFQEIVLLMDCCRDDYPRAPIYVPAWPEVRRPAGADVRYFYGFATKWSRKAREKEIAPGGPVQGLFTRSLLAALTQATPDENGFITGAVIEKYVYNYLPTLVDTADYQEPRFDYETMRDIVFVDTAAVDKAAAPAWGAPPPNVRVTVSPALVGQPIEILDHHFATVATHTATAEAWSITLADGMYMVRIPGSDKERIIEVIGQEVVNVYLE
ncbi:MAG: hypothetical protein FOGNACKC_01982 [Anaerolineae bacterium]|nr:hypothetical protein [Anaerolineae bacterium]